MGHRIHFAGVNTRRLAEAAKGQDILMSYADVKKDAGFWGWMKPLLERGYFRSVILDSGAFTELSQRKLGKEFTVSVEEFGEFAAEHQHLFTWVANLDDIEGDVERSNTNYAKLCAAGVDMAKLVPVYHEGESLEQLCHCLELARRGRRILAVGAQRPKGRLVPRNVVRFLSRLFITLEHEAHGIEVHGFGLTRYASEAMPCKDAAPARFSEGFPFRSTDSTTWIAEACSVERSGAVRGKDRSEARSKAFRAVIASYSAVDFAVGRARTRSLDGTEGFRYHEAWEYGHQARTVAKRLERRYTRGIDWGLPGGAQPKRVDPGVCPVERHKLVRHGSLNMATGEVKEDVKPPTWETAPCGVPLFERQQDRGGIGICRSCADGWAVEENYPTPHGADTITNALGLEVTRDQHGIMWRFRDQLALESSPSGVHGRVVAWRCAPDLATAIEQAKEYR